jgi:hypothetical protein
MILENTHYSEKGILEIDNLRRNINLKRTYFNWDHLDNLQ